MEKIFTTNKYLIEVLYHIGSYENSIHFIVDKNSKKCAIVDPAWEADLFIKRIQEKGYKLTDILITHWHYDHTNAVDEIADKTKAKISAGVNEIKNLALKNKIQPLADGDTISLGESKIKVISTPGHTSGGVSYLLDKHLIAGDTLFVYGAGICAFSDANPAVLFDSLNKLKKQIKDEVYLLCGHNYGVELTTTMAKQKKYNPFLLIDNKDDFIKYRTKIHDTTRKYPMAPMNIDELQKLL